MKIASVIAAAVIAAVAAVYIMQPGNPPCGDNILASNIVGCDIKGPAK